MLHATFTRSILVTFLFLLTNIAFPQRPSTQPSPGNKPGNNSQQAFGVISGSLTDELTKERIEYGSTALYRAKDSALITGAITDAKGKFTYTNITPGQYYLKASFIGYEMRYFSDITISHKSADVKLGDISLKAQQSDLSGIEVVAKKALISNNLDKKVVTVDKSMALSGGTAADVMENVPSVAVDAEGNVSLRGNQNITLLIDGKPASQAGISSSDILNQLPASAIESVEVITNPSVRYDPDGTSGIINIVLKKKALQGFNGLVSGTIGTNDKYNGSLNLNYRANKVNLFVGVDARYNLMSTSSESERISTFGEVINTLRQTQSGEFSRNSLNLSGGLEYTIDTRNDLSFSIQRRNMAFIQEGTTFYKNYLGNGSLLRYFDRYSNSDRSINSMSYTLSYKHKFAQKGSEFTQDIIYSDNEMNSDQKIEQKDYNLSNFQENTLLMKQRNFAYNKNYFVTAQGNFIYPSATGARVEAGYKFSFRDMGMDYDYTNFNPINNEWENLELLKNHYDYKEQIYAVYGIYGNSWKKFKYQAGLRYELVYADSKIEQNNKTYNKTYSSLYPSLHTQYDLGKGRELQFSYSRRVERPSPREMNPYVDYSDSLNIRQGNPDLDPEYTNSIEFGLMKYWDKYSLTSNAFFRNTNGMVEDIIRMDSSGVTFSMPQNISNSKSYGLEFVANGNPYKWLRLTSNLSFYNAMVDAVPEYNIPKTENISMSCRLNATFTYSKTGSFQLIGNYTAPKQELQSREEGSYYMDVSLRQDFFKGKLSASLRVTDVFNTRNHNSTTTSTNFTSTNKRYFESRVLYAGLQLKINNYSRKVEKDRLNGDMNEEGF